MAQGKLKHLAEWLGIAAGVSQVCVAGAGIVRSWQFYAKFLPQLPLNTDTWGLILLLVASLVLVGGSIASMRGRAWGQFLSILVACFLLLISLGAFLMYGFLGDHLLVTTNFVWGIVLLFSFSKFTGHPVRRFRWVYTGTAVLWMVIVVLYFIGLHVFMPAGVLHHVPGKIVVPMTRGPAASVERHVLNIGLNLPSDFVVNFAYHSESPSGRIHDLAPPATEFVQFINKDRTMWIAVDRSSTFDGLARFYGSQDTADFARSLIREPVALPAHLVRSMLGYEFDEIEVGKWEGIQMIRTKPMTEWHEWTYHLWHRKSGQAVMIDIDVKEGATPEVVARDVISTLHLVDIEGDGGIFLRRGKALIDEGRPENAKFELVNTMLLGSDHAEVHYWMARAFFDTEKYSSAIDHAERALAVRPDYPEASELKAKAEEARKTKQGSTTSAPR